MLSYRGIFFLFHEGYTQSLGRHAEVDQKRNPIQEAGACFSCSPVVIAELYNYRLFMKYKSCAFSVSVPA